MISIIISSVNKACLAAVSANIEATIGLEYELIAIDNSKGEFGICEVYNQGAARARYEILCFMHEDISIETNDWGAKILALFHDANVGLVGVAGSTYRSLTPSGWFPPSEFGSRPWRLNVKQGFKYQKREAGHDYFNPKNEVTSKVVCIDGLWFCTRKQITDQIKFDAIMLKGFHGYDIDFSLAVNDQHTVLVTYDVLVKHDSDGNFNSAWLRELIKVQRKWDKSLPINYEGYAPEEVISLEASALKRFLKEYAKNPHFTLNERVFLIRHYYYLGKISLTMAIKMLLKVLRSGLVKK